MFCLCRGKMPFVEKRVTQGERFGQLTQNVRKKMLRFIESALWSVREYMWKYGCMALAHCNEWNIKKKITPQHNYIIFLGIIKETFKVQGV